MLFLTIAFILHLIELVSADCGYPGQFEGQFANVSLLHSYPEGFTFRFKCVVNSPLQVTQATSITCSKGVWLGHDKLQPCPHEISDDLELVQIVVKEDGNLITQLNYTHQHNLSVIKAGDKVCLDVASQSRNPQLQIELSHDVNVNTLIFETNRKGSLSLSLPNRKCSLVDIHDVNVDRHDKLIQPWLMSITTDDFETVDQLDTRFLTFQCEYDFDGATNESNQFLIVNHSRLITMDVRDSDHIILCGLDLFYTKPFKCGRPPEPLHSTYRPSQFPVTATTSSNVKFSLNTTKIKYYCRSGYALHSFSRVYEHLDGLVCGLDGKWLGEPPVCRPEVTCDLSQLHVELHNTLDKLVGAKLVVIENPNYFRGKAEASFETVLTFVCNNVTVTTNCHEGNWTQVLPVDCLPRLIDRIIDRPSKCSRRFLQLLVLVTILGIAIIVFARRNIRKNKEQRHKSIRKLSFCQDILSVHYSVDQRRLTIVPEVSETESTS